MANCEKCKSAITLSNKALDVVIPLSGSTVHTIHELTCIKCFKKY